MHSLVPSLSTFVASYFHKALTTTDGIVLESQPSPSLVSPSTVDIAEYLIHMMAMFTYDVNASYPDNLSSDLTFFKRELLLEEDLLHWMFATLQLLNRLNDGVNSRTWKSTLLALLSISAKCLFDQAIILCVNSMLASENAIDIEAFNKNEASILKVLEYNVFLKEDVYTANMCLYYDFMEKCVQYADQSMNMRKRLKSH